MPVSLNQLISTLQQLMQPGPSQPKQSRPPAHSQQQQQQTKQVQAPIAPGRHGAPTQVSRRTVNLPNLSSGQTAPAAAAAAGGGGAGHADDPSPSKGQAVCSKSQHATAARSSDQQTAGTKRRLLQPSGKQKQSAKQARVEEVKAEPGKADVTAAAGGQGAADHPPAAGGKGKGAAGKNRPKATSGGSAAAPLPGTVLSAAAPEAEREQAGGTGTASRVRPLADSWAAIKMAGKAAELAGAIQGEVSRNRRPAPRSTEAETVADVAKLRQKLAIAQAQAAAAARDSDQLRQQLATAKVEAGVAVTEALRLREQLATAQGEAAEAGAEAAQSKQQLAASQAEAAAAKAEAVQVKERLVTAQTEAAAAAVTKLAALTSDLPQLLQHVGAWFQQQQGEAQQLQKETQELCAQKVAALGSLAGMDLPVGLLGPQQVQEQQQEGRVRIQGQDGVAGSDGVCKALQLLGDEAVKVKGEVEKLQQRRRGVLGVVVPGTCSLV